MWQNGTRDFLFRFITFPFCKSGPVSSSKNLKKSLGCSFCGYYIK